MNLLIKVTTKRREPTKRMRVYRVRPESSVFLDDLYDCAFRFHNTSGRTQFLSVEKARKA